MKVHFAPQFESWLSVLASEDLEVFGDVMALVNALEVHGKD